MSSPFAQTSRESLREQVAVTAARFIAEDGLDYAGAKQRALREITGDARGHHDAMPDNARVEEAVREHQALFMADTQPRRLLALRRVAIDAMRFLADAGPELVAYATGAIVNGTAGEHSDVHLLIHGDNAKDVEIFLVNAGVDYEAAEVPGGEVLGFLWPQRRVPTPLQRTATGQEAVHLSVLDPRVLRNATAGTPRLDVTALQRLVDASAASPQEQP